MVKRTKKQHTKDRKDKQRVESVVDSYARVLQIFAIISVVAIFVVNGVFENSDVPIWVPAGLLGVAVGLSPEQIGKIVTDIIKAAIGKR